MKKILLLEDDPQIIDFINELADKLGLDITLPTEFTEGFKLLDSGQFGIVILEAQPSIKMSFPGVWVDDDTGGLRGKSYLPLFLNPILKARQIPKFIIIARGGFSAEARYALNKGAIGYIQIPQLRADDGSFVTDFNRFEEQLKGCLLRASSITKIEQHEHLELDGIIGTSPQLKDALTRLADSVKNDFNVLIRGETGTGKRLFASKIHQNSNRKGMDVTIFDCGLLQQSEISLNKLNELLLAIVPETKSAGTIIFHEISYLPISVQASLLAFVRQNWQRNGEIDRLPHYRILSTSSKDLNSLIAANQFSEELYFELNTIEFTLPPLRERGDDIIQIATYYINGIQNDAKKNCSIKMSDDFITALRGYNWPGNIPELKNALRVAVNDTIEDQPLSAAFLPNKIKIASSQVLFNDSLLIDDETIQDVFELMNAPGKMNAPSTQIDDNFFPGSQTDKNDDIGQSETQLPKFCFYKWGDFWKIGNPASPIPLKDKKGYEYIHFLLQYPNKSFKPIEVYHMGIYPSESDSLKMQFDKHTEGELYTKGSLSLQFEEIKKVSNKDLKKLIMMLEEKLATDNLQDSEKDKVQTQLRELKLYQMPKKAKRDHLSLHEKARSNITRAISKVLKEINEQIPELMKYINKSTIVTGDNTVYRPIVGNEPDWILNSDDH